MVVGSTSTAWVRAHRVSACRCRGLRRRPTQAGRLASVRSPVPIPAASDGNRSARHHGRRSRRWSFGQPAPCGTGRDQSVTLPASEPSAILTQREGNWSRGGSKSCIRHQRHTSGAARIHPIRRATNDTLPTFNRRRMKDAQARSTTTDFHPIERESVAGPFSARRRRAPRPQRPRPPRGRSGAAWTGCAARAA